MWQQSCLQGNILPRYDFRERSKFDPQFGLALTWYPRSHLPLGGKKVLSTTFVRSKVLKFELEQWTLVSKICRSAWVVCFGWSTHLWCLLLIFVDTYGSIVWATSSLLPQCFIWDKKSAQNTGLHGLICWTFQRDVGVKSITWNASKCHP